jgi:hypothetical protein
VIDDDVSGLDDLDGLDADGLLSVIEDCERRVAALSARQAAAMAAFEECRAGTALGEFAADEVALALSLSTNQARDRMATAETLTRRLPGTLAALARGELDYYRARCFAEAVWPVADDAVAAAVQAAVLPDAAGKTAAQLRAALRRAVLAADPAGAEARHRQATAERGLDLLARDDGMATVWLDAPADDAVAVYTAFDGLARAARRAPGEARTLAQLRADLLVGVARDILAAGGWAGLAIPARRGRAQLHVTVGADTLLGVSDEPGWLAGYGAIPASMARRVATDATWRRLLTDPVTGSLLDFSATGHDPGAVVAGHVLARDQTCVCGSCTTPAAACDLDHTVAHPQGPTWVGNLAPLCRRRHRAKQAGFALRQDRPGVFTWTTPTGRTYRRRPPPIATPRPDYITRLRPPGRGRTPPD